MSRLAWCPVLALTALATVLAGAAPVAAQPIACGDSIGPGKVTLTADIGPCTSATDPALVITGPAKVDMAGFRVLCDEMDPPNVGIELLLKGVQLVGGSLSGCSTGIVLRDEGKHKLEALAVTGAVGDGIQVNSDGNKLRRLASTRNGDDGIEVNGASNKVEDVAAVGNEDTGFRISGNGNSFKRILATGNEGGVFTSGTAAGTKIKDSALVDNGENGALVGGTGTSIEKSALVANSAGIFVANQGQVKQNRVFDNNSRGIDTGPTAGGSSITKNVVIGNAPDLRDETPGGTCGSNQWEKNVFGTSDADGTPSPICIE